MVIVINTKKSFKDQLKEKYERFKESREEAKERAIERLEQRAARAERIGKAKRKILKAEKGLPKSTGLQHFLFGDQQRNKTNKTAINPMGIPPPYNQLQGLDLGIPRPKNQLEGLFGIGTQQPKQKKKARYEYIRVRR